MHYIICTVFKKMFYTCYFSLFVANILSAPLIIPCQAPNPQKMHLIIDNLHPTKS